MIKPVQFTSGVIPYYIKVSDRINVSSYYAAMQEMSDRLWTYFGYSGLAVPWYSNASTELEKSKLHLIDFVRALEGNNISFYAYCLLIIPLCSYESYRYPHYLFLNEKVNGEWWTWLKKLRSYVNTKENLDKVAHFLELFYAQQIEYSGKAFVRRSSVIGRNPDGTGVHFEAYHRIFDRINQIEKNGAPYEIWVKTKFANGKKAFNDEINLRALINVNKLDPDMKKLVVTSKDPWTEIKEFLGLSVDCKIVDDYIPKGWMPSDDDFDNMQQIVEVRGDGFYFYPDGTQRRGKRHYASNTYYGIKCNSENFQLFRDDWRDLTFLTERPTWEEYNQWAIHPGIWGEDGKSLSGMVKSIKWRKK